jgi:Pentapeptide repeats (8 copies)
MNATKAWYIRSQSVEGVKGPFPGGQISQEMLLGRYKLDDEVSHDKEEWITIRDIPELIPEIFTEDRNDPDFKSRLEAARRWADERRGIDEIDEHDERRVNESYESAEIKRLHRLATESKKPIKPMATFIQLGIVFIVIISVVVLAFQYSPEEKGVVDCASPAKQGVNLSGCNLSGSKLENADLMAANLMNVNLQTANLKRANLSLANLKYAQLHLTNLKYTNFTKADLTGANFMGADLSEAIFNQANLSYANFRDANILTTDFTNARLDHAIWIDGRKCRPQSISTCN